MAERMIFKEDDEEAFWSYWQKFIEENRTSPRYSPSYLKWMLQLTKERGWFFIDKSFIYLVNNKIAACVFLPLEKRKENVVGGMWGDYIFAPLITDDSLRKKTFSLIDNVARENKVAKIMFSQDPLETKDGYNYLQKYGYLDASILSYVIDLGISDDLLGACRKGHRQSIEKILNDKNFSAIFMDKTNPSYELHGEYVAMHHKASGRTTRSRETFDMQFERLKEGDAALFGLKYLGSGVAFGYFDVHADKATYSSGADDPDYGTFFLYHALLYEAMKYFKARGVKYIDTGQPSSPSAQFDYYPDKKQLNIAFFKRGFAGGFRPQFRGIKYLSKEAFEEDVSIFKEKYGEVTITAV